MRIVFAVLLLAGIGALAGTAKADPYRWCADYAGFRGLGATNCWFMTIEQCRAAVSGVGGYCKPNPFYDGKPIVTPTPVQRTRKPAS